MFTSPSHSQRTSTSSVSPSHGKLPRDQLSTTTSDDVFVSPAHAANPSIAEESTDGGGCSEFDAVKRSDTTLEHVSIGTFLSIFGCAILLYLHFTDIPLPYLTIVCTLKIFTQLIILL